MPQMKRVYFAIMLEPSLLERVKTLAHQTHRTPRQIVEMCLEDHLPALEAESPPPSALPAKAPAPKVSVTLPAALVNELISCLNPQKSKRRKAP